MSDLLLNQLNRPLNVEDPLDEELLQKISYALSVPERIKILKSLLKESKNVTQISQELDLPIASVARHINILAEAQLIFLNYQPGPKGHTKYCALAASGYSVSFLPKPRETNYSHTYSVELPIGMFSHCHIEKPCGMLGKNKQLFPFDSPSHFFRPERMEAECLWFDKGFVSYNFPTPIEEIREHNFTEISFSFEVCSETNCYNNNWPSDITIYINKLEILTFTSLGDFGGRRGKYSPEYWPTTSTQFGILKHLSINETGVYLDNQLINKKIKIHDLNLFNGSSIQFTIGIKDDAKYVGGINLFGKNFGDYPQAIIMKLKATPHTPIELKS